ncbi:MAG: LLM class flavin-dependent oxidoreductase [Arcanobacterium sp.]|nr:LLM class flavin-dependent oxidoreductase [Arcanobacterium sp.]
MATLETQIAPQDLDFGIDTFGDNNAESQHQSLLNVVEQAKLADELGLHSFNLGEHHRDDYTISSPLTTIGYLAGVTKNIHLGTAVVVLSSEDPVRVYEQAATTHVLSGGRVELTVGRGSFTESFPLFGYKLQDYEPLFDEKLEMLVKIWNERPFSWEGHFTQKLDRQLLYPEIDTSTLPVFVAVGGSPQSVVRTAHFDLGLRLAIIGGAPERFAPFADLYRREQEEFGHTQRRSIGFHAPGIVADTDDEAVDAFRDDYLRFNKRVGAERGWPPMTEARFRQEVEDGALFVGSPQTVATKLARAFRALGADTFNMKMGQGNQDQHLKSIDLYANKVIPMVRDMLS